MLHSVFFLLAMAAPLEPPASTINDDEVVQFFPTYGYRSDAREWALRVHGWIYEPEGREDLVRGVLDLIELDSDEPLDRALLTARISLFLVDSERDERIRVRVADQTFLLPPSGANGHFEGQVRIRATPENDAPTELPLHAVLSEGDSRTFRGTVRLIEAEGLSIISDIDDTIRSAGVADTEALVSGTLGRPYEAAPGMAPLYQRWAQEHGAAFHYVSGSPWQLSRVIEAFLAEAGFPAGSLHLRELRLSDTDTVAAFFDPPVETKRAAIERILADFPRRRFILVGDSSERDPELFGEFARRHIGQVRKVLIREVGNGSSARYAEAFEGVSGARWTVFRQASEVSLEP